MDLPRATDNNVCVINIPQKSLLIFFFILASYVALVSFFSSFFIYLFIRIKLVPTLKLKILIHKLKVLNLLLF